ncbi:interleukin-1 receptor-associated kinase 1 isoform X1 [Entelurus aequoreus]|uniref:interleukin-1 receptor-associated kinase 1 isoform X1 n=1 Tax=Entelurus aequoreus TaxID=161455 RepID=UPI002B1DB004|nr:interleukin-1 receptor-associated kinase 1 isoform X1 [Entelurus aequoreus]
MSRGDVRGHFLYQLPAPVHWEFCRVMDGLSDLDWTRFASEVLQDQVSVRLAERKERRTDCVMSQWMNRNGRVGDLLDLLEHLQLLRPRDVILGWASSLSPPAPVAPPAAPFRPPDAFCAFDPPPKFVVAPPTLTTHVIGNKVDKGGGGTLPRPDPPPFSLQSERPGSPQAPPVVAIGDGGCGVMRWSYEEVHAGTEGFSPALQVGEGGFGNVYRASMRNTDCAVKRLKEDCLLDFAVLKESFDAEVEKLSKFRHRNIVDLLGFCEGPGGFCLIYSYMENRSLEDQLHSGSRALPWSERVRVVVEASAALQFLHFPPEGHSAVIHGDVKSSNILLDRHMVAKLADFGLARFVPQRPASKTTTLGRTSTLRGTQAYLPEEYVRNGKLGTTVDVYSFGVVLLEVLTGRRALVKDTYLKDLVQDVQEGPDGSSTSAWRQQLDRRLITAGGATEPVGSMQMAALACVCLDKMWKKRPDMKQVLDKLQDIHKLVGKSDRPCPPPSSDCSVAVLSQQLSSLGPLEDTYKPLSSLPPPPSSFSSSFEGPCETDESRGFSQYHLFASKTLSTPTRDQKHSQSRPSQSLFGKPSQDNVRPGPSLQPSSPQMGVVPGPGSIEQPGAEGFSPAGSLQSVSPQSSGRFPPDGAQPGKASRCPEESDELDFLADC